MNQEALIILAEECAEVQQAISKIQRFGADDKNVRQLENEIGDVLAMIAILGHENAVNDDVILRRVPAKLRKLKKYSDIKDLDSILKNL